MVAISTVVQAEEKSPTPEIQTMMLSELNASALELKLPALKELGRRYQNGIGVEKDEGMAQAYYLSAAEKHDDAESYYRLYELTTGPESSSYQYKAGKLGYGIAQAEIGFVLLKSDDPDVQASGLNWIRKAAIRDIPLGNFLLGQHYLEGTPLPDELEKGKKYMLKASEGGSTNADFSLGMLHALGENGFEKDPKKTFFYMKRAARNPSLQAAHITIGRMYLEGEGGETSMSEAMAWLRISIEGDNEEFKKIAGRLLKLLNEKLPESIKAEADTRYKELKSEFKKKNFLR